MPLTGEGLADRLAMIDAAEREAKALLGHWVINAGGDPTDQLYKAIARIADLDEEERAPLVCNEALDAHTVYIDAAYLFGVAMGRLTGGGR